MRVAKKPASLTISNYLILNEGDEKKLRKGKHLVLSVSANSLAIQSLLDNRSKAELIEHSLMHK